MLSIREVDSFKKMKAIDVIAILLAAGATGFFGTVLLLALHDGIYVPALWCILMLVVYLPLVSIVCKKEGNKKLWRRRVLMSFASFTVFALIVGTGLVFIFN